MAPSIPGLIFPPCPICGRKVDSTDYREAYWYDIAEAAPGRRTESWVMAGPPPPFALTEREAETFGAPLRQVEVAGARRAPANDQYVLRPCGCFLIGPVGHEYSADALNLTYPDVLIEVSVILPAGCLHEAPTPARLATSARYAVDDVADHPELRIPGEIRRAARQLARQVRETAGVPEPPIPDDLADGKISDQTRIMHLRLRADRAEACAVIEKLIKQGRASSADLADVSKQIIGALGELQWYDPGTVDELLNEREEMRDRLGAMREQARDRT